MLDLFNARGEFTPLADDAVKQLDDVSRRLYDDCERSYRRVEAIESEIKVATDALHSTVKEIRNVEARLANLPGKRTFMDEWRATRGMQM